MNSKITLLTIMLIVAATCRSFGAFPVKNFSETSTPVLQTNEPAENIAADYESEKTTLFPYMQQYNFSNPKKCLVSKIGRGTMITGGGIFVTGTLIGLTKANDDATEWLPSTRAKWIAVSFLLGAAVVIIGCALAIGGGIYNMANSRYSLVTDKVNEAGIAYNFK